MFASIKTNGATHIAIHVPHEGSEKSLPSLLAMLEQNATFINSNYSQMDVVKPSMTIILGDKFMTEHAETIIEVKPSGAVLSEDFVVYSTEVSISNKNALKKEKDEVSRLRTELSFVKDQLKFSQAQVEALTKIEEA